MDRPSTLLGGLLDPPEVDQATGMLSVQLGVSVAVAGARLRAFVVAVDRELVEVACDIVDRRLRLSDFPTQRSWS